jgi:hypothetical protein
MFEHPDDQLSSAERQAFAALPREQQPDETLEERVVALLRREGHLATPITAGQRHHARTPRVWWVSGAVAAALAVFASGVAVGQLLGTRSALRVMDANSRMSAAELAARVQRAGAIYVAALASLSHLPDTASPSAKDSAQDAAVKVLGQAAQEIALLMPDDPLAAAVLRGLNQRSREQDPTVPSLSVVWY